MKNIEIALFTVVALSSCGGGEQKCEGNCADSTAVVAPAVDSTVAKVDTTKADTTAAASTTVK